MFHAYLTFWAKLTVSLTKPYIIGVTGSVGKTTTTEMLASVLTNERIAKIIGKTEYSKDNLNNDLGLPAALLLFEDWNRVPFNFWGKLRMMVQLPFHVASILIRYPKFLVLEYGAGSDGHIPYLVSVVRPDIAILTTIGPAHLSRFNNTLGVAEEKRILLQAVPEFGLVLIGEDHEYVSFLQQGVKANIVTLPGRGLELSKLITLTVCDFLKIPEDISRQEVLKFSPPKGRLNYIKSGDMTIIDDSFNANPLSMKHGLDMLQKSIGAERRVAVLGKMSELGEREEEYHKEIGQYAHAKADLVIGVGQMAKYYEPDLWFTDSHMCADKIKDLLLQNDIVFIKGSHAANMRHIVKILND